MELAAMTRATPTVIMPRRGFLTRALGFTAAGATLALPIITVDDARARATHHLRELKRALKDLYPTREITATARFPQGVEGEYMHDQYLVVVKADKLAKDEERWLSAIAQASRNWGQP
jgi:hypothetical protein